jgi:prepilin-type processing-associated H-X9-DG protein
VFVNSGVNDGWANRTSYLLNSQLSHKTRRWGRWNLAGFTDKVGVSNFIDYCERDAVGVLTSALSGEPRQDDYDIWVGVVNFQPWIATQRHGYANYLFLDGHITPYRWVTGDATSPAGIGMFPDSYNLPIPTLRMTAQGFYPTDTPVAGDDPWGGN